MRYESFGPVSNPDGSPTQTTIDMLAGTGRDPFAFAADSRARQEHDEDCGTLCTVEAEGGKCRCFHSCCLCSSLADDDPSTAQDEDEYREIVTRSSRRGYTSEADWDRLAELQEPPTTPDPS